MAVAPRPAAVWARIDGLAAFAGRRSRQSASATFAKQATDQQPIALPYGMRAALPQYRSIGRRRYDRRKNPADHRKTLQAPTPQDTGILRGAVGHGTGACGPVRMGGC